MGCWDAGGALWEPDGEADVVPGRGEVADAAGRPGRPAAGARGTRAMLMLMGPSAQDPAGADPQARRNFHAVTASPKGTSDFWRSSGRAVRCAEAPLLTVGNSQAVVDIVLDISDLKHLETIITGLRKIPGVRDVQRLQKI